MSTMKFLWPVNGICDSVYVKISLKDKWYYVNTLENPYAILHLGLFINLSCAYTNCAGLCPLEKASGNFTKNIIYQSNE